MIFPRFPKVRPELSAEMQKRYIEQYKANREGGTAAASLAQKMEAWMHTQVAQDVQSPASKHTTTLELGAGTLNQLQYEPSVMSYDIVEPFKELYEKSPFITRIRNTYATIHDIPDGVHYDRITSIAVLEHVCDLPALVARSGLLLANNGVFHASIPNEGTWLWTLGWKLTTGLEFRLKYGLDYGELMRHEHVNTAHEIEDVLNYFFEKIQCKVFGLNKSTAFYRYYACSQPNILRCKDYLKIER